MPAEVATPAWRLPGWLILLALGAATPHAGAADVDPARIGAAEVVLPGFQPLSIQGLQLQLGAGRRYDFTTGILPVATDALGQRLTGPFGLEFGLNGVRRALTTGNLRVVTATHHHVILTGTEVVDDSLSVESLIRVEYDGLASVDLTLRPTGRVVLGAVTLTVPVARTPDTRLLAYDPETIYDYRKQEVFPACKPLPYKNVLGLNDTLRSFWLVIDEPALPGKPASRPLTELSCTPEQVLVRQPLLPALTLTEPLTLRWAFLATPIRDQPPAFRRDRVVPNMNPGEERLGNRQLWWVDALPHYALPYATYPPGAREQLSPADLAEWPGLQANREALLRWRRLGIERLPYMSLRAPSVLDAFVVENEAAWRVLPPMTLPAVGDGRYRQGFSRPLYSHRAPGFTDYLVSRLDEVLGEIPVRGFYFDQAEPIGSGNPLHLTSDTRIRPSGATDVLAMRLFFKRLATAIHARGREPLIYVHNSMTTVIPAYTFVTAMVQGEEFNSRLKGLNYQASVDYETVQSTFHSGAFGIPVIWLEEVWSDYLKAQRPARFRNDSTAWMQSREYETQWRNFMSVALLHDVPVWTLASQQARARLWRQLDDFGVARSSFSGYWLLDPGWRTRTILISTYERPDGRRLAVIVNRGQQVRELTAADLEPFLGPLAEGSALSKHLGTRVPPEDFVLVTF